MAEQPRKRLWPQLDNMQLLSLIEHYRTRAEAASDLAVVSRSLRAAERAEEELQARWDEES